MRLARPLAALLVLAAGCNGGGGFDGDGAPAAFDVYRASVASGGAEGNAGSDAPALTADGRIAVFASSASNLEGGDVNGVPDAFLRDQDADDTERLSDGDLPSGAPAVTADGGVVAFVSSATDLVAGDLNGFDDVFVRDVADAVTSRESVGPAGAEADGPSEGPSLSATGALLAFSSRASNLVAGDTNGQFDVFVVDRSSGTAARASVSTAGAQADDDSREAALSGDGSVVAFSSQATNLVGGDTNGFLDVFVRDLAAGTTRRASLTNAGGQANGDSFRPAVSEDGRYVAFVSTATNLVPGDLNGVADVFVRDLVALTTTRASVDSAGAEAGGPSGAPSISADGRYVAFESTASNLVADDLNGASDVFVRDVFSGNAGRASLDKDGAEASGASRRPAISADGARIAFVSNAADLVAGDMNLAFDVFVAPNPLRR